MSNQSRDFAEFYRRSKDECLLAVLVSVADRDVAQELVAEAFARAWAAWRTVGKHPAPQAWVVRTALNASVSRWRRRRRELLVADPRAGAQSESAEDVDGVMDPRVRAALSRLSDRQRQVVALRVFMDLDTNRTAQLLGIAPGTVQAHLGRAIAALRDDLIPQRQQEDLS